VRIAILGGTFDPIHNGHLAAAQSVSSAFRTDEVRLFPLSLRHTSSRTTASPRSIVSPWSRSHFSIREVPRFQHGSGCDGKRYTVDTLERLRAENPDGELLFVLGTDMYRDFETWKNYRALFTLAHIVVVHRPGFAFRKIWRRIVFSAKATLSRSPASPVFSICRSLSNPFLRRTSAKHAIAAMTQADGCRRPSGVTSENTNFTHEVKDYSQRNPGQPTD
jgi:nicotinate-nucleotide adenylyltransferase